MVNSLKDLCASHVAFLLSDTMVKMRRSLLIAIVHGFFDGTRVSPCSGYPGFCYADRRVASASSLGWWPLDWSGWICRFLAGPIWRFCWLPKAREEVWLVTVLEAVCVVTPRQHGRLRWFCSRQGLRDALRLAPLVALWQDFGGVAYGIRLLRFGGGELETSPT